MPNLVSKSNVYDLTSLLDRTLFWCLGKIFGALYGFRMDGIGGARDGWRCLRIHPRAIFCVERGAKLLPKGELIIGYPVKTGVPFPSNYHAGLVIKADGRFASGDRTILATGAHVHVSPGASVSIGEGTFVGYRSQIVARREITIGSHCALAWGVTILDSHLHQLEGVPYAEPVSIGSRVWIGHNVSILQGVTIGDGAIIGANSLVTKDIPPNSLAIGSPANVIRENVKWAL